MKNKHRHRRLKRQIAKLRRVAPPLFALGFLSVERNLGSQLRGQ